MPRKLKRLLNTLLALVPLLLGVIVFAIGITVKSITDITYEDRLSNLSQLSAVLQGTPEGDVATLYTSIIPLFSSSYYLYMLSATFLFICSIITIHLLKRK